MYSPSGQVKKAPVVKTLNVASFESDDHPALARNLERELDRHRMDNIAGFVSAKDWADFQKRRGVVEGLELAISLCQNQQKLLSGK